MVAVQGIPLPYPQNFNDAVKQAQQMSLIPVGAVVDRTSSGIQVHNMTFIKTSNIHSDTTFYNYGNTVL